MRETYTITSVGSMIEFTINPDLLSKLEIDLGDLAEIEIYEIIKGTNPKKISVFMTQKIITIGGGSKGVTIKHNIAKEFDLKASNIIGVDIKANLY